MADDEPSAKLLERRVIWEGNVGSFGLDTVILPSGEQVTLALFKHPGASAIVPFLDDAHVVLLRQFRHAAGGEIWEVPAGKLDRGEDPLRCAERELEEETGYRAGRIVKTGSVLTTPGFTDELIHLFCAWDLSPGKFAPEAHEVLRTEVVALERALAMIESGEIRDGKSIAALFLAARRGRRE